MTRPEIIRMLDLLAGLSLGEDPRSACESVRAYCQMLKEQLLNEIVELPLNTNPEGLKK